MSASQLPPPYSDSSSESKINTLVEDGSKDSIKRDVTNLTNKQQEADYAVYLISEGFFFKTVKVCVCESKYLSSGFCCIRKLTQKQAYDIYDHIIKYHGVIQKSGRINELFMSYEQAVNLMNQLKTINDKYDNLNSLKEQEQGDAYFTMLLVTKTKDGNVYVRILRKYEKYDKTIDYNKKLPLYNEGEKWKYMVRGENWLIMEIYDYLIQTHGKKDLLDNRLYTSIENAINTTSTINGIINSNTYKRI